MPGTPRPEEKRRRRRGPLPKRVPSDVRRLLKELRSPERKPPLGLTEREIAQELQAAALTANTAWDDAAVRRLIRAIREERRIFFERVDVILETIESSPEAYTPAKFVSLCVDRGFDSYWLWDQFQDRRLFPRPLDGDDDLAPPILVDFDAETVVVSPAGQRLRTHWASIQDIPSEILDVLAAIEMTGPSMGPNIPALCRRYHADFSDLTAKRLVDLDDSGIPRLTAAGGQAGSQWALDDRLEGLDWLWEWIYWPNRSEEKSLPTHWDWKHRPLCQTG